MNPRHHFPYLAAGAAGFAAALAGLCHALLSPSFALPLPDWSSAHAAAYATLATLLAWAGVLPLCLAAAWAFARGWRGPVAPSPLLLVGLLAAGMLACAGPALTADFHFDDLFLLRPYAAAELASTWVSSWDPNGVLRPAYRPLMTAGAAAAHALLGEHPWLHRLVNTGMFSLGWVLFFRAVLGPARFAPCGPALLLLWLSSSAVSIYSGWVTEGYRALHLLLFSLSLLSLQRALPDLSRRGLIASLLLFAACLLTREEALPLSLWLAGSVYACARRGADGNPVPRARLALAAYLLAPVGLVALRVVFVGGGERLDPAGPFALIGRAFGSFPLGGALILGILAIGWFRRGGDRTYMVFCLAMAALAAVPGLGMVRLDVALFPLLFLLAACAPGLIHLRGAGPAHRLALTTLLLAGVVFALPNQWLRMRDLLPGSLHDIQRNCRVLHGDLAERGAIVPPARRARFEARHALHGIPPGPAFAPRVEELLAVALREGRFTPGPGDALFRHAWDFLSSQPGTWKVFRLQALREAERRAGPPP